MTDPITIKLAVPVQHAGQELTELRFETLPLALHVIDAQIAGNRIDREVLLISLLASVSRALVRRMVRTDFLAATAAVKALIGSDSDDAAWPDDPRAPRTVTLSAAIKNATGDEVTELVLTEPRVLDLAEAAEADDENPLGERARVIASIAGVPYAGLRQLPASDFVRLLAAADPFFAPSPGTGAT